MQAGNRTYDFIIAGGGPAGCVLAARLSEDPDASVLLIEAGPDYGADLADWPPEIVNGVGIQPDSHPWGYVQANDPRNPPLALPRARIIGGSAAINGCTWVHGTATDYDLWGELGNAGWSFDAILDGFRKAEADPIGGDYHGIDGPVPIFRRADALHMPVHAAVIDAAMELNLPWIDDVNGSPRQFPGVGMNAMNLHNFVRMHGGLTYLARARGRDNLTIVDNALVDRVELDGTTARRVKIADGRAFEGKEIILSAGAYGSPAILLRSGIGPAAHLQDVGIPVHLDAPGVGEHLNDHPAITFPSPFPIRPGLAPDETIHNPILIRGKSSLSPDEMDFHMYHGQRHDPGGWVTWVDVVVHDARLEGSVKLTSADPAATLVIDHRHLSDPRDMEILCDACELAADIVDSAIVRRVLEPAPKARTWRNRDELRAFAQRLVGTMFHPSGTTKMGPREDPMAVVDHAGRVHGVDGLRVVDTSIFPTSPRGNTHGPVVASAELIAAKIAAGA